MRILVTGGFGFIGSNFINQIWSKYRNDLSQVSIVCIDSMTYAANPQNVHSEILNSNNFKHHIVDIANAAEINKVLKGETFDMCIHFAAESHVDRSISDPLIFAKTNFLGTANLLDSWSRYQKGRFVHISTDEVYGSVSHGFSDESAPLNPSSPYSASKAGSDLLVLSHSKTFGTDVVVTRCTNNYGPGQNSEKFIPKSIEMLTAKKSVPVYGDGLYIREWIHVNDHVNAIIKLMESPKLNHQVYNIGSGIEKTNLEILDLLSEIIPDTKNIFSYVEDRAGHDRRYALDSSRIKNELNWSTEIDLRSGLTDLVAHYQ